LYKIQPSVLSKASDIKALIRTAYKMAELKQKKYSDKFSAQPTLFILTRVLDMDYPQIAEK